MYPYLVIIGFVALWVLGFYVRRTRFDDSIFQSILKGFDFAILLLIRLIVLAIVVYAASVIWPYFF